MNLQEESSPLVLEFPHRCSYPFTIDCRHSNTAFFWILSISRSLRSSLQIHTRKDYFPTIIDMPKKFLLILLFAISMASCNSQMTPEEEIREYISSVGKHFTNRQARKLKQYISEIYHDNFGNTQKDILHFAAGYIFRHPSIHIESKITELVILADNNKAQVKMDVAVSKEPFDDNDIRLLQGEFHRFLLHLEKSKGWQLRSLQWQKITIDDYLND